MHRFFIDFDDDIFNNFLRFKSDNNINRKDRYIFNCLLSYALTHIDFFKSVCPDCFVSYEDKILNDLRMSARLQDFMLSDEDIFLDCF